MRLGERMRLGKRCGWAMRLGKGYGGRKDMAVERISLWKGYRAGKWKDEGAGRMRCGGHYGGCLD
jgi:hypothetical protein